MSKLFDALQKHARDGIIPDDGGVHPAGTLGSPLIQNVHGYGVVDLLLAAFGGAVVTLAASVIVLYFINAMPVSPGDHRALDAIHGTGVDVGELSLADLKARLSYRSEDGQIIIQTYQDTHPNFVEDTVVVLRKLPPDDRRSFLSDVLSMAQQFQANNVTKKFLEWVLSLDYKTILNFSEAEVQLPELVRQFVSMPPLDREMIAALGLPKMMASLRSKESVARCR